MERRREIERDRKGMAEKFLERRKEPGKIRCPYGRERERKREREEKREKERERERMNKRAGLPGTGSRGIMIILSVGKE